MNSNVFEIPWLMSVEDGFSFSVASDLLSKNISMTFFSGLEREESWLSLPSFIIPKKNRSFGSYISFEKGNLRNYQSKNSFGLLRYYYNENNELRTDKVTIMSESLLSPEKSLKLAENLSAITRKEIEPS